jgi:hypothetical protein
MPDDETKTRDEVSSAAVAAATEESEPATADEAPAGSDPDASQDDSDDDFTAVGEGGTQRIRVGDTPSAEEDVTDESTTDEGVPPPADLPYPEPPTGEDEGDETTVPEPIGDDGTEPGDLVDPAHLEEADFPINDIKIGNRSQFADRVVDPSSSVLPHDLRFVGPSVPQGSGRPTEDEERELFEVRRGTMEPPDMTFGAGPGVASTEPDVSEEVTSGVEPDRFALLQQPPPVTFEDSEGEPHEIQIDSTENFGEPTDFPIDGVPAEPPPAEEPPDPEA